MYCIMKINNDLSSLNTNEIILTEGKKFKDFPKTPLPEIVYDGVFKEFNFIKYILKKRGKFLS